MAEERIEIGSYCLVSWNVGLADTDFHPIEPPSADRHEGACALLRKPAATAELRTTPVIIETTSGSG